MAFVTAFFHNNGCFGSRGEALMGFYPISITMSVLTGERINFLVEAC